MYSTVEVYYACGCTETKVVYKSEELKTIKKANDAIHKPCFACRMQDGPTRFPVSVGRRKGE